MELRTALARELEMLKESFNLEAASAMDVIQGAVNGRSRSHAAFNLAARASELAAIAGKIDATEKILRSIEG